jgi:hypothetical protein
LAVSLCLVALINTAAANATEVLDQSFIAGVPTNSVANIYGPPGPVSTAETFTAGLSGVLSRVNVEVAHYPGAGDLSVRILTTTDGVPDTTWNSVLGVASVPASSVPYAQGLVSVPLTGAPIHVTPGEVLAIALSIDTTGGTSYQWYGIASHDVPYAGGTTFQEYFSTNGQWKSVAESSGFGAQGYSFASGFQTYVTVPEPVGVAGIGLLAVVLRWRRKSEPSLAT